MQKKVALKGDEEQPRRSENISIEEKELEKPKTEIN